MCARAHTHTNTHTHTHTQNNQNGCPSPVIRKHQINVIAVFSSSSEWDSLCKHTLDIFSTAIHHFENHPCAWHSAVRNFKCLGRGAVQVAVPFTDAQWMASLCISGKQIPPRSLWVALSLRIFWILMIHWILKQQNIIYETRWAGKRAASR